MLSFYIDVSTLYFLACTLDQSGNLLLMLALSVSLAEAAVVAISGATTIYVGGTYYYSTALARTVQRAKYIAQMLRAPRVRGHTSLFLVT